MYSVAGLIIAGLLLGGCARPMEKTGTGPVKGTVIGDPAFVEDCQPCELRVSDAAGVYALRFRLESVDGGRVVRAIEVNAPGVTQTLEVKEMLPAAAGPRIFFGGQDINFDGQRDLMLMTSQGTANANALYWLFDGATKQFRLLGEYPVFTIDAEKRQLQTYERGGSGGMIYEARQYRFADGKLTVTRMEKQEPGQTGETFTRTVEELREGKMVLVEKKTVRAPQ